jgi:hypothetical protein
VSSHCAPRATAPLPLFEHAALECGVAARRGVAGLSVEQRERNREGARRVLEILEQQERANNR